MFKIIEQKMGGKNVRLLKKCKTKCEMKNCDEKCSWLVWKYVRHWRGCSTILPFSISFTPPNSGGCSSSSIQFQSGDRREHWLVLAWTSRVCPWALEWRRVALCQPPRHPVLPHTNTSRALQPLHINKYSSRQPESYKTLYQ